MVTIDRIQQLYSRTPLIKPPQDVYILDKGTVRSDRFFDLGMFHQESKWIVRGMTPSDKSEAIFTRDSTDRTVLHEALHSNGIGSELFVRPLAMMAEIRARFNLGILRKDIQYEEVPMSKEEKFAYLKSRGIEPSQNYPDVPIYHYKIAGV